MRQMEVTGGISGSIASEATNSEGKYVFSQELFLVPRLSAIISPHMVLESTR